MHKRVKIADVLTRDRKSESRVEQMPGWKSLQSDIHKGIKPKEALEVKLTEEIKEECGIQNRRTVARFLQKYIAEHDLPYRVRSLRSDGVDVVYVMN